MARCTVKQILALAKKQVGVTESPKNSNNVKYNTWFYGKKVNGEAYPWCCAFINWLFNELDSNQLFCDGKKVGYCPTVHEWAKTNNLVIYDKTKSASCLKNGKPGDLVLFDWSGGHSSRDHIGIIVSKNSDGSYTTIEGNTSPTNAGSQSNGEGVYKKVRATRFISVIIRPNYGVSKFTGELPTLPSRGYFKGGDKGDEALKLKKFLVWATDYKLNSEKILGSSSVKAIKAFQKDNGLVSDGLFGKKSLEVAKKLVK